MNTLALGLTLLLLSIGPAALEVEGDLVYSPQRTFRIPLDLTAEERAELTAVRLYVSQDQGRNWVRHSDGDAQVEVITFRAKDDGEYWFTIGLVNSRGEQVPADVRTVEPGLKVLVDTVKPELTVKAIRDRAGRRGIRWIHQDASIVPSSLRVAAWNDSTKEWSARPVRHPEDSMLWFEDGEFVPKLQVSVFDVAGNEQVIEIDVMGDQFSQNAVSAFALDSLPQDDRLQLASASGPEDAGEAVTPADHRHDEPAAVADAEVTLCSSNQVVVNYVVEARSGQAVPRAELWATKDRGATWFLAAVDEDGQSPVEARLPSDGIFGLRILLATPERAADRPQPGDQPEMSVEIDTVAPEIRFTDAHVVESQMMVRWEANDEHLDDQPIDILYGHSPQGPWRPVATGLRNTGEFSWDLSGTSVPATFFLRIEARDRARHVGFAISQTPVRTAERVNR